MQVNSRDDAHIPLTPLASTVGDLGFEQLEGVEAEIGLGDFDALFEDRAGFVLDEEEGAVGFAFGYLLEEAQEIDVCEEEAGGVGCERGLREGAGCWVA